MTYRKLFIENTPVFRTYIENKDQNGSTYASYSNGVKIIPSNSISSRALTLEKINRIGNIIRGNEGAALSPKNKEIIWKVIAENQD